MNINQGGSIPKPALPTASAESVTRHPQLGTVRCTCGIRRERVQFEQFSDTAFTSVNAISFCKRAVFTGASFT